MRIVFMGTPQYAVPSLAALASFAPRHELAAIVTQPDRAKGRSRKPQPPAVKTASLELGLPAERILQPETVNDPATQEALRTLRPDLFCVVSYGAILRRNTLRIPRLALNAHGSLLPRFRGAAPIQAALLAGDAETGVTIQKMVRKMDAGPILLRHATPIRPGETAGELHDRLAELSAQCFKEAIEILERGQPAFEAQDETQVTFAPKLTKESGTVDWSREAAFVERFIRAMSPWPGAWTSVAMGNRQTKRLRIGLTSLTKEMAPPGEPGDACCAVDDVSKAAHLLVRCGDGIGLSVATLQPEGGREMTVGAWLRGAGRCCGENCKLA
jgi:methionyl-tRNA formyltransferase